MLMTPDSYKGLANGYEYTADTDTTDTLTRVTPSELHLVGKIKHETFNIPQWLPSNIKVEIKITLAPSNSIFQKVLATAPDVTVSLTSKILHIRKQHVYELWLLWQC